MQKEALMYYLEGYNCSQCILKAAETVYGIPVGRQSMNMCRGINNGFGFGGMCSVLIAGIMVFGMLFDEQTSKRLRMRLLHDFSLKHKDMNCVTLKKERQSGQKCEDLVEEIAGLVHQIIQEERR